MSQPVDPIVDWLLAGVKVVLADLPPAAMPAPFQADLFVALAEYQWTPPPPPARLPVCRFLPSPAVLPANPLLERFLVAEPTLHWRQNPGYVRRPPDPQFLDRYGYCELIGRQAPAAHPNLALGFLLLGPATTYPDHHHPAAELYLVLHGTAAWRRAGGDWAAHPPGTAIFHDRWQIHATRTGAEPLLALYAWIGDIESPAVLVA